MDRLAAEGVRFSNAVSPSPWTLPALATLMTSLYPSIHEASLPSDLTDWGKDRESFKPTNSLHESRLVWAEILQSKGFATAGFVRGSYPSPAFGFAQGFDLYVANPKERAPSIRSSVEALFQWLQSVGTSRFFAYLHTVEVHSPYFPPIIPMSLGRCLLSSSTRCEA
jgi:arylsulfatase A-like enzyme